MTFLYNIIISPIEIIIDYVFTLFSCQFFHLGPLVCLYAISLVVNFLSLPVYRYAEKLQKDTSAKIKKLENGEKRIKKAFKGNERFMMLQEYYRQNNYRPLERLKSSMAIIVELPFFIAAYHYLSGATHLKNSVFWIISDLSSPDALLHLSLFGQSVTVNVLPVVMTAISIISTVIYTKGSTKRDKIQGLILPILFLILLYNSPSGLVLYWIFNNLFSLIKNIVTRTRIAKEITGTLIGLNIILFGILVYFFPETGIKNNAFIIVCGIVVVFCSIFIKKIKSTNCYCFIKDKISSLVSVDIQNGRRTLISLILSGLALFMLLGIVVPSNAIASSPTEFVSLSSVSDGVGYSPLNIVRYTGFVFFGIFVFWPLLMYFLMSNNKTARGTLSVCMTLLCVCVLFNVFVFKSNYGNIDSRFFLDFPENLLKQGIINTVGPIVVLVLFFLLIKRLMRMGKTNIINCMLLVVLSAEIVLGIKNTVFIKEVIQSQPGLTKKQESPITPIYHLSKTGKNVVVLFFDRANSVFFDYAKDEFPEFAKIFDGFTFFPNTLSSHVTTIGGAPSMLGGYEYTMESINKREDESLVDKHNEALLVAPALFKNAGYSVTVTDPPFCNYTYYGDLSPYENEKTKGIYTEQLDTAYSGRTLKAFINEHGLSSASSSEDETNKEAVNFSILQALLPVLRYKFNKYLRNPNTALEMDRIRFLAPFSALYYITDMTDFNQEGNTYTFIGNNTTHEPAPLSEGFVLPTDFEHSVKVDLPSDNYFTLISYQTFVASMKQVARWIEALKQAGVYDNTRIIITSDHGCSISFNDEERKDEWEQVYRASPLLMFKDFNSNGSLQIDDTFMTNSDTLFLSKTGLDEISDVNPFTGKKLTQNKEEGFSTYFAPISVHAVFLKSKTNKKFSMDKNALYRYSGNGSIFNRSSWKQTEE